MNKDESILLAKDCTYTITVNKTIEVTISVNENKEGLFTYNIEISSLSKSRVSSSTVDTILLEDITINPKDYMMDYSDDDEDDEDDEF